MTGRELSLIVIASAIFAMGLVMIFSTTSAEVLDLGLEKSASHSMQKQMSFALFGSLLATVVYRSGYRHIINVSGYLLAVFSIFLILALIPGIGKEVNGSKRWVSLMGFSFQPSEFVKYLVPLYFLKEYLADGGKNDLYRFLKKVTLCMLPVILIWVEPNNGTAAVIVFVLVILFYLLNIPWKYWALPLCLCVVVGGICATQIPYVKARLKVYMNPELDLKGKGHQPYQAKIAAGSGELLGKGPGNSWQKLSYLPEAQNDYIGAIYAEEWGFVGVALLITLYMLLTYLGYLFASTASDVEGYYVAGFVTALISIQAFLNLGVVSGLIPSTGLNLPLFSQGGSSLMANMAGLGLLLSVKGQREYKEAT